MIRILLITDYRSQVKVRKVTRLLESKTCKVHHSTVQSASKNLVNKWDGIILLIDSMVNNKKMMELIRQKNTVNAETYFVCEQLQVMKYKNASIAYSNMPSHAYAQEEKDPVADMMKAYLAALPKKE